MPLNGQGDDCIQVNTEFVVSLYGTDSVFTAEGQDLRVRPYGNQRSQTWTCVKNGNNRIAFQNLDTNRFLGRNAGGNLCCSSTVFDDWEVLAFTKLSTGGHEMNVPWGDGVAQIEYAEDSGGPYMKVASASDQAIGLHLYKPLPFQNFRWVIPGRLARSSAAHFSSDDLDEDMDQEAVDYLKKYGITSIISLNSPSLPSQATDRLQSNGISYDHISVTEFYAPTLDQLEQLNKLYQSQTVTLISAGFGYGRTGTAISALQLYDGRTLSDGDFRTNNVDSPDQIRVLKNLRSKLDQ
ncbi:hypothetical protein F4810DRAFT_720507 [Camillea tinctor]|nr:hypothetical protein F4810DRAFT_720507 [Camillea tinctor]